MYCVWSGGGGVRRVLSVVCVSVCVGEGRAGQGGRGGNNTAKHKDETKRDETKRLHTRKMNRKGDRKRLNTS